MILDSNLLFFTTLFVGFANLALIIYGNQSNTFIYWPPPQKNSWQFYCIWSLFISFTFFYLILFYMSIDRKNESTLLFLVGLTLSITGLVFANYITYRLGIENASGLKRGLKTKGWYSISRNPVYTATFVALLGAMILIPIYEIILLSSLWIFSYVIAVRAEEKWLEKEYGEEYLRYKENVPRFFWGKLL